MGYGSYSVKDWEKLKLSKNLSFKQDVTSQNYIEPDVKEVFTKTSCDPKFNPRYIGTRECFDSEEHPHSTPIVVGLDVTGSMGFLAVEIATKALNNLILKLYSTGLVEDPALMCAAYGDFMDQSPLQVTQFESDIRIAEQLLELFFENRGSGRVVPTCLWEFLCEHTNIDAFNKRKEKGFVFTIGDDAEIRYDRVDDTIQWVIGDRNIHYAKTREGIYNEVQKKFNVFHIMIGSKYQSFMEGHQICISKNDIIYLPEIIISVIMLYKGKNIGEIVSQWDQLSRGVIKNAISQLCITDNGNDISL